MIRNSLKLATALFLATCTAPSFAVPVTDIPADVLIAMAPDLRKALALNANQNILWGQVDGRSHTILRERTARRERLQRLAKTVVTTPSPELRTLGAAMDAEDSATQAEEKQLRDMWLTVNDALDEKQRLQVAEFIGEQLERVEGGPMRGDSEKRGGGDKPQRGGGKGGMGGMGGAGGMGGGGINIGTGAGMGQ